MGVVSIIRKLACLGPSDQAHSTGWEELPNKPSSPSKIKATIPRRRGTTTQFTTKKPPKHVRFASDTQAPSERKRREFRRTSRSYVPGRYAPEQPSLDLFNTGSVDCLLDPLDGVSSRDLMSADERVV